jgi:site-specific recombinase XerD
MIERAGEAAGLSFKAHPHMLRHACGFAPTRFKDFWRT